MAVPGFGEFVECERCSGDLGMDGKKAGARRGFEHKLAGRNLRGEAHQKAKAKRRGELLELARFPPTCGVCEGRSAASLLEHGKVAGRRCRPS